MQQHLLCFRIIIQEVDRQIRNELHENKPNSAFFKLLYDKMSFGYNPCKNKKAFNGVFSEINAKTGVK